MHQTTVDIIRHARAGGGAAPGMGGPMPPYGHPGGAGMAAMAPRPLPPSLLLLPLYAMSLQKSLVLRGGGDVRVDERSYYQIAFFNSDLQVSKLFTYPRMFSLHDMGGDVGLPLGEAGEGDEAEADGLLTAGRRRVRLPNLLNLSYERLSSAGIFLLENGFDLYMWLGRLVNPALLSTLFSLPSLEGVDMGAVSLRGENSDLSSRVVAVIEALREERPSQYLQLHYIREGEGWGESYFARFLVEDRANFSGGGLSYTEYHAHVNRAVGV